MTYAEAMEVRLRYSQRQPVDPADLELANRMVKAVRQMQADIPEPEPVAPVAAKKTPFPAERILVQPTEPLPRFITALLQLAARPAGEAAKPPPEPVDHPMAGPWKPVTAMVLTHDRKSVSLGQLHKVPVQAIDFYP